jgi:hypothetical protein
MKIVKIQGEGSKEIISKIRYSPQNIMMTSDVGHVCNPSDSLI